MSSTTDTDVSYLLGLEAVRERAQTVLRIAEAGSLNNFDYDATRMAEVTDFVVGIMQVRVPTSHLGTRNLYTEAADSVTLALTDSPKSPLTGAGNTLTSAGSRGLALF
jgi:hypothetical protein